MTAAAPSAKPLLRSATIEMITTGMRASVRHLLEAAEELPAVHVGQHDVEGDQRQRLLHREDQRRLGGGGVQHLEALRLELHADQLRGLEVVLHHQRGARARPAPRRGARPATLADASARLLRRPERQPDREAGALAHGALHRHRAAVQLGEELDHGQPEPRALELSRQAAVDLTERLEEVLQPLRRDADAAVGDADLEKLGELVVGQREAPARPGARRAGRPRRAGRGAARRVTWPPSTVNFTALESRL